MPREEEKKGSLDIMGRGQEGCVFPSAEGCNTTKTNTY